MSVIEEEQEKNRVLLNQLSIQEDLTNELIGNQQVENDIHRENYQAIASVMRHLQSPVNSVVDNLAGIISSVDDSETQSTLRQCMNTASDVAHSFNEVADFCLDVCDAQTPHQTVVNLKTFIEDIVSEYQSTQGINKPRSLKLHFDQNTPEVCPVYAETVRAVIHNLLNELVNLSSETGILIQISVDDNEMKYGVQISDLSFRLDLETNAECVWGGSWAEAIQQNQQRLLNAGFNLLRTRDALRKAGGLLNVNRQEGHIKGFQFSLPLTY